MNFLKLCIFIAIFNADSILAKRNRCFTKHCAQYIQIINNPMGLYGTVEICSRYIMNSCCQHALLCNHRLFWSYNHWGVKSNINWWWIFRWHKPADSKIGFMFKCIRSSNVFPTIFYWKWNFLIQKFWFTFSAIKKTTETVVKRDKNDCSVL